MLDLKLNIISMPLYLQKNFRILKPRLKAHWEDGRSLNFSFKVWFSSDSNSVALWNLLPSEASRLSPRNMILKAFKL